MDERYLFVNNEKTEARIVSDMIFYLGSIDGYEDDILKAYAMIMEIIQPHLRTCRWQGLRCRSITDYSFDVFSSWISQERLIRQNLELEYYSGSDCYEVGEYNFRLWMPLNSIDNEVGYVQVGFPMSFVMGEPSAFKELAVSVASLLPLYSGNAGLAVEFNNHIDSSERDRQIFAWCRRYQGVDCKDLGYSASYVKESIRGISWLTFVDSSLLQDIESDRLSDVASMVTWLSDKRVMFTAGDTPSLCDKNRQDDIAPYRILFRLLRSKFADEHPCLPGIDEESTLEWLRRFEGE